MCAHGYGEPVSGFSTDRSATEELDAADPHSYSVTDPEGHQWYFTQPID